MSTTSNSLNLSITGETTSTVSDNGIHAAPAIADVNSSTSFEMVDTITTHRGPRTAISVRHTPTSASPNRGVIKPPTPGKASPRASTLKDKPPPSSLTEKLKSKIAQLEQQLEVVSKQAEEYRQEAATATQGWEIEHETKLNLEKEYNRVYEQCRYDQGVAVQAQQSAETITASLRQEIEIMKQESAAATSKLVNQATEIHQEKEMMKTLLEAAYGNLELFSQQDTTRKAEMATASAEIATLMTAGKSVEEQNSQYKSHLIDLQSKYQAIEAQNTELQRIVTEFKNQYMAIENKAAAASNDSMMMQQQLTAREGEIVRLSEAKKAAD